MLSSLFFKTPEILMIDKPQYDHRSIEKKWQEYWKTQKTFKSKIDFNKPKYYALDMFPYPSGAGLHVGHPVGYTATDIMSRYKRHRGFNVLHPMGWDSFGLPAEQYAIRTGTHPEQTTKNNIDNFRSQLQQLGFSYDWDRELATSDASYYKWTQWIFTLLYQKGLAYEAELQVNYCPALGTVLANEEVENGKSKDGGHPIERRPLKQWVLKITAYADRLIEDLEGLDWPEGLKKLQINWIGRSEGATIHFPAKSEKITVFTTRPDTLFGVTYLVLAPEHPLVDHFTTAEQKEKVTNYRLKAALKSDMERTELAKEKTGVWTGSYAQNPATGQEVPIWISDYVLMGYGSGAVMGVPAHDERDFEFAHLFKLKISPVYIPNDEKIRSEVQAGVICWIGDGACTHSANQSVSLNGMSMADAKTAIITWLEKSGHGRKTISYKLRDWLFSRQRYWGEPFPVLHFQDGSKRVLDVDELPLLLPPCDDFKPSGDGLSPLGKLTSWLNITDSKTKKPARREVNTMPNWAGSCWYYLRFCDPTNETEAFSAEAEKYWMPVDLYIGGAEHAVLHLLYARFWHKVLYDCGLVHTKEPFQALRNQGLITSRSFKKSSGVYVSPDDVEEKDGEYFERNSQEHLQTQVEKMSKSKLNGVDPQEIVQEYGADALRLYEMFLAPLEKEKVWNTEAISGVRRFLQRFFEIATSDKVSNSSCDACMKLAHKLLDSVIIEVEQMQFNTAISKMMIFVNEISKQKIYSKESLKIAALVLSPFAPHLAEEVWQLLGEKGSMSGVIYPTVDPKYLQEGMATFVIQVNGKLRGSFTLPKDQSKEELIELAEQDPVIAKYLEEEVAKIVFIPGKLLNFVMKS